MMCFYVFAVTTNSLDNPFRRTTYVSAYQNGGCYLQCGAHWHITHYYAIFSVRPCCQPSYCCRQLSWQLMAAQYDGWI